MKREAFDKTKLKGIQKDMKAVYQIPGIQSVWEHGLSVAYHYKLLINELTKISLGEKCSEDIFIPEVLKEHAAFILSKITVSPRDMQKYLVYHDMGKPSSYAKDEFG